MTSRTSTPSWPSCGHRHRHPHGRALPRDRTVRPGPARCRRRQPRPLGGLRQPGRQARGRPARRSRVGSRPLFRRYFDPAAYRVVLLDQRNCGRSTPHASDPSTGASTSRGRWSPRGNSRAPGRTASSSSSAAPGTPPPTAAWAKRSWPPPIVSPPGPVPRPSHPNDVRPSLPWGTASRTSRRNVVSTLRVNASGPDPPRTGGISNCGPAGVLCPPRPKLPFSESQEAGASWR